MRALLLAGAVALIGTQPSSAAALAPAEIQATFFTGQPFTAATTNIKYKMVFTTDGKMTREPIGSGGAKNEGTWKLSKDGFCTTWKGSKANCVSLARRRRNKWSCERATVSHWSSEPSSTVPGQVRDGRALPGSDWRGPRHKVAFRNAWSVRPS